MIHYSVYLMYTFKLKSELEIALPYFSCYISLHHAAYPLS